MTNEDWKEGDDVLVDMSYECLPTIPEVDLSKVSLENWLQKLIQKTSKKPWPTWLKRLKTLKIAKKAQKPKTATKLRSISWAKLTMFHLRGGQADAYPLVLGSNSFIPGFEEQLVGAKVGDDVLVKSFFPS